MPDTWENFVADWAADRGLCRTDVIARLAGTPLWAKARIHHETGEREKDCRSLLDQALASIGMTPNKMD
ncbi:MAG TPA: hypothetical protein VMY35_20025 [Phycisphaerae bacterium]|nr:hypothetical protein [Phycisphaerae bacterium]